MNKILFTAATLATLGFFAVNAANAADGRDQTERAAINQSVGEASWSLNAPMIVEGRNAAVVAGPSDAYIAQSVEQNARSTR